MATKPYIVFIFRVFNAISEDKSALVDDCTIELIGTNLEEVEARALEVSGRKYARILSIIEKF